MNSHATARNRIKVDLERDLFIADPQAEQTAHGTLIAPSLMLNTGLPINDVNRRERSSLVSLPM